MHGGHSGAPLRRRDPRPGPGWRCAACLGYFPSAGSLVVDHDHWTDLIRGLLCTRCNVSEPDNDCAVFQWYRAMAPARPRVWFYGGYRKGEPAEVYSATTGVAVSPARQATRRQAMSGYTRLHGAGLAIAATTLDPGTRKEMACDVLRHLFAADHSEKVTAG